MKEFSHGHLVKRTRTRAFSLLRTVSLSGLTLAMVAGMQLAPAAAAQGPIAARYRNDAGIADDPDVVFSDDFESWKGSGTQPPAGKWSVRKNKISLTRAVRGKVAPRGSTGPDENVLKIACWTVGKGSQTGGLSLKLGNYNHANEKLGNGYEDLYIRRPNRSLFR